MVKNIIGSFVILFTTILQASSCSEDIESFMKHKQKASLHIDAGSSNFTVGVELRVARDYLTNAIISCKDTASSKQIKEMKSDLKKLNSVIKAFN